MVFFDQVFEPSDLIKVATLAFIELLLSADNALVLGTLVRSLPERLRKRALFIGVVSAFVLRGMALLGVSYLIRFRWLQLLGALYLVYVAARHFIKQRGPTKPIQASSHFWITVLKIELFDLAFAIDSIIAGIVFIASVPHDEGIHPKLWIVYVGGMLGLLGIRYAAGLFSTLLIRFPRLETSAYLMIGWIGLKLGVQSIFNIQGISPFFWGGLAALFAMGFFQARRQPKM
jgi:YkoY family integral membrane protein